MFADALRYQFGKPSGMLGAFIVGPAMNFANMRLMSAAIELLDPRTRDRLLDIGFGGGFSLFALASKVPRGKIVGVDYSQDMVEQAARRIRDRDLERRVRVECASVETLPFPEATFDRILTVNSIYYWPHIVSSLRETARVLKPRGRIVVGFRSRACLGPYTSDWKQFHLYEPNQFARLMQRAGYNVSKVEHRPEFPLLDQVLVVGTI